MLKYFNQSNDNDVQVDKNDIVPDNHKNFEEIVDIFKVIFETSREGILIVDQEKNIVFSNATFENITDLQPKNSIDEHIFRLHNNEIMSLSMMIDIFQKRKHNFKMLLIKAKAIRNNRETPMNITFKSFFANGERGDELIHISFDDTTLEQAVYDYEHHYNLTNLPNKLEAYTYLGKIITSYSSAEFELGVMVIDIDNIIKIKASLGLTKCDNLIVKVGELLKLICEELGARLFHLSYSNFMVIAPQINTPKEAEYIHKRFKTDIQQSLKNELGHIHLTCSTGVSFYPQSGRSLDILIDNSYKALLIAKEKGEGNIAYDPNILSDNQDLDELNMLNEMKKGLVNHDFELHYQPLINIETGKIEGAEALVRWKHPLHGLISPNAFIPLAKKSGFIIELGKFIITQAIKQQRLWQDFYPDSNIVIDINLSLREMEIGGFVEFVQSQLTKFNIPPKLIRFEIPEDIAMANTELAKKNFFCLKRLGVLIALDNFGLGQSSLVHLKELPLDALKIDLSYITNLAHNKNDQRLTKAMMTLGKNFDLKVIVSGIENQSIYSIVKHYGCDIAQGYLFSKPLPVFEFQKLLRTYKHPDGIAAPQKPKTKIEQSEKSQKVPLAEKSEKLAYVEQMQKLNNPFDMFERNQTLFEESDLDFYEFK